MPWRLASGSIAALSHRGDRAGEAVLAGRGYTRPSGVRLHTLADAFAYGAAEGVTLRVDASEIRSAGLVSDGPAARRSGKGRQVTIMATVVVDEYGATLWWGGHGPGRMHDTTAARVEGIGRLPAGAGTGRRRWSIPSMSRRVQVRVCGWSVCVSDTVRFGNEGASPSP
jgi:hypothetical protein